MTLVHVNVPYPMLRRQIGLVFEKRIHPEIYFSGEDLDTCREEDVEDLAARLRGKGLEVTLHGPFMDLSPGGTDTKVKEVTTNRFRRAMELARFFRARAVVFHPGYEKWKFDGNEEMWLESSLETWPPLVKMAEGFGLTLAMENVFEETPGPLRALLERIRSPHFRFCFDTGHAHLFSKVSLPHWLDALAEYLHEVHLHDNHQVWDEHLPVGEGGFDFDQFFNLLSRYQLNPIYTIEPHEESHLRRGLDGLKKYLRIENNL